MRWAAVPQATAQTMAKDVSNSDPDALQLEMAQRLEQDAVRFDLMVSFATENDDENNPTLPWPANRQTLHAGTIVIRAMQAQHEGTCDGINFDPLVLPKGMEPTADPILNARGAAYAESYRRRALETLLDPNKQAAARVQPWAM